MSGYFFETRCISYGEGAQPPAVVVMKKILN